MNAKLWFRFILMGLMLSALVLAGCDDGDDGKDGKDGADGAPGGSVVNVLIDPPATLAIEVTDITIDSPPVVSFTATNSEGVAVIALCDYRDSRDRGAVRFSMAKLAPGSSPDVQSMWLDYVTGERNHVGTCVDNLDGTYIYTFEKDLGEYDPAITYDATATTRLAIQQSSIDGIEPLNVIDDFIPAGGEVTPGVQNRDIVTIDACNSCHGELAFHGGGRYLTEYCVVCHNPTMAEGEGEFTFMVHKIHAAGTFDVLDDAIDYSEVTYPQDLRNCTTCHKGADSDAWLTLQNELVCTVCHTAEEMGVPHSITDATPACSVCHPAIAPPLDIAAFHVTDNATANNPMVPEGAVNFTYDLLSAAVDAATNVATIEFQILEDGEALTALPPTGVTDRAPVFLFAYALPQDGIDEPADFNNRGNSAAQPTSLDLDEVLLTNTAGTFTATVADAFPVGATLRTVGLQGYYIQTLDPELARHTVSDVVAVTDDEVRREVVDSAKCSACHEFFEAHGGNRVFSADGGVQICTTCHVPNLSSSGTTLDLTNPEDTNNFGPMIHGIHAATDRPYEFVRNFRDAARFYDWSEVTFPGILSNCNTCHLEDTYVLDDLPTGLLDTTVRIPGDGTIDGIKTARDNVPNPNDLVVSPISSACYYCHDSDAAASHMVLNGGYFGERQFSPPLLTESCVVCHGEGAAYDISTAHGL